MFFFSSNKCNLRVAIHFSFIENIYKDSPKGSFIGEPYESFYVSFLDLFFETNGNGNSDPPIMFHTSLRPMSLHHSIAHCNTTNHIMFFYEKTFFWCYNLGFDVETTFHDVFFGLPK
jgi:hypothetical protein